jgi:NADH dehydrogenase/NADH:ubiquinone oxidoreductase subunit G
MPALTINGQKVAVEHGAMLIDACLKAGVEIPHLCYHPCLKPVATCRMCVVEVKGQAKLVTACSTPAEEGMEICTDTPAVADARAGVMEFLLLNHPLDCPICDQAGECKLQDYSYRYGSHESRFQESKAHFAFENLGNKIVMDKNRCIHCTRCARFFRDVTETCELTAASRGPHLEITTYAGPGLDANPFAGNLADICPVGALTSRDFRFKKRAWHLKPIPTISRHGADAKTIWADVAQNRLWRFRPRPMGDNGPARLISDEERSAWHRYDLSPSQRPTAPTLNKNKASAQEIAEALGKHSPMAVLAQGAFGCDALHLLKELASAETLLFAHGNVQRSVLNAKIQQSEDGIINRKGIIDRGYRFGALQELLSKVEAKEVGAVVIYHDSEFSDEAENATLSRIAEKAAFSLLLEPIPSTLAELATATLPVTTYLEEADFIIDHLGRAKHYAKALEPPKGIKPPGEWVREIRDFAPR